MRFTLRLIVVATLFLAVNRTVIGGSPNVIKGVRGTLGHCPKFLRGRQVGALRSASINEASGIAASRKNCDVLWVHNDAGDSARVFAINSKGRVLGIYKLSGASARDYEDIAIGPGPDPNKDYLYIGDIGDNKARRSSVVVYRVTEPTVDANQAPVNVTLRGVESIEIKYPGGARNAETLIVDPVSKDIYIVSKETATKVYRAAYPQSTTKATTMKQVARLGWGKAVAGDISPAGDMVIVRGYFRASVWYRPKGANLWEAFSGQECSIPLILERQGEAICFDANGSGYFTVSEHLYQPIYYFARPVINEIKID